ncbi:CheR family methyltransferase [Pseudosulfitobacter sp. SM2401]|uniref:CheR family methyltransferase n=1 Tax=Pseudosulfitobacter sp. SM2401 TaxID=3350098 RepID=UPI0036F32637
MLNRETQTQRGEVLTEMSGRDAWTFSQADFESIAQIAKTYFGLNLSRSKMALIQSRLGQRMKQLGMSSFSDYLVRLQGPLAKDERTELLSVLTTNVTHFFREQHHFDALRNTILPPLLKAAAEGQRVRLWSAGCSTGPEAFSLAMTILDLCPAAKTWDLKILATDIDPIVIETAKVAQFPQAELDGIPRELQTKYVTETGPSGVGEIKGNVRSMITFGVLNLIDPLPFHGPFDVVLCRNVAIYFDRDTQTKLWRTFSDVMAPGGHLFIGHSEHLTGAAKSEFSKTGFTMYQRKGV